jgi:peroxiredoxin
MALKVGDMAPEFTLHDTDKKERSLKELMGKKTVLAFFPGAFTGVCTKEMCTLRDSLSSFNGLSAQVVGISVDSPITNKNFATQNNLTFPILSDFNRTVSKQYCGLVDNFAGIKGYLASNRSVFVLDGSGKVTYAWIGEHPGLEPPYEEINNALKAF